MHAQITRHVARDLNRLKSTVLDTIAKLEAFFRG